MRYIIIICITVYIYFLDGADFKALLFNGNCTTCHFIDKAVSAPSMKEVQKVYKKAFPKKVDFINYMTNWVAHPNKDDSLMYYAIDKYELMPELAFEKDTLYEITEYIYNLK